MFFYDDDDDGDDDVWVIHTTSLVDTPSSWVQLLRIPVSELSNSVNMILMFVSPCIIIRFK